MTRASDVMDFEAAAGCATGSSAMSHIQAARASIPPLSTRPICLPPIAKAATPASRCFSSAPARTGATGPIFPRHAPDMPTGRGTGSFIGQFYDERTAPKLMLTSEELADKALLAEALSLRAEHKVEISMPQRGEKREIMERALTNAREQLGRRMAENSAQAHCWTAWRKCSAWTAAAAYRGL